MTTIVTRAGKGSPLTNAEVDANFTNLNDNKVETAVGVVTSGSYANPAWLTSLAESKVLPAQTGQSGKYLTTNGTLTSWATLDLSTKADVGGGNATGTWPISVTGNAATVTNGVYTSGSYANPAWITALAETKVLPSQSGQSGKYLQTNGTSTSWATLTNPNNGTLTLGVSGTGLSGSATFTADQAGNSTFTVTSNATNANTGSTIVARDASGNFSAGTITATLSGNATNVTGTVAVANGGTGSTTAAGARSNLGLSNAAVTPLMSVGGGWSQVAWVDASGLLEIGRYIDFHSTSTSTEDYTVRLDGGAAGSTTLSLTGSFVASGNVTAYSDERLKKDWEKLQSDLVDRIATVKRGTYTRTDSGERQIGVSAQELQKVIPEAVVAGEDGTLSVAYGNAALVVALELAEQVVALRAEVAALKEKVNAD